MIDLYLDLQKTYKYLPIFINMKIIKIDIKYDDLGEQLFEIVMSLDTPEYYCCFDIRRDFSLPNQILSLKNSQSFKYYPEILLFQDCITLHFEKYSSKVNDIGLKVKKLQTNYSVNHIHFSVAIEEYD